jgi:small membrane protein
MILRVVLLAAIAAAGYHFFLRRRRLPVHIALLFALLATAGVFVARPDLSDPIARWLGVERGADLVVYLVVVGLLFVSLHYYTKFVELHAQTTTLARELALLRAELDYGKNRTIAGPSEPASHGGKRVQA